MCEDWHASNSRQGQDLSSPILWHHSMPQMLRAAWKVCAQKTEVAQVEASLQAAERRARQGLVLRPLLNPQPAGPNRHSKCNP